MAAMILGGLGMAAALAGYLASALAFRFGGMLMCAILFAASAGVFLSGLVGAIAG